MRCSRRLATEAPIASARVVKTVERLEMVWLDLHMLGLRRGYLLWTQAGQHANRVFAVVAACRLSVDANEHRRAANEKRALRFVGVCFLLLAAYVAYESATDLWLRRAPEHSTPRIIL